MGGIIEFVMIGVVEIANVVWGVWISVFGICKVVDGIDDVVCGGGSGGTGDCD